MKVSRTIRLAGAVGANIRTAVFENREYLVVPVVALVEGVVWAVNSPKPELVLAEEFSRVPGGWDGRPVVLDHPDVDGTKVSANSPEMLEKYSFGKIFNTLSKDKKLGMEAWLDESKAAKVGAEAVAICEKAKNSEAIEVSVGVFMSLEETEGLWNDKEYSGIWRDLVPDHLAMLPEGKEGACSNEMGCGAPRAATVHLVTAQGYVPRYEKLCTTETTMAVATQTSEETKVRSLKERFKSLLGFVNAEKADMSANHINEALSRSATDVIPGFMWVDEFFPEKNEVIVAAMTSDHDLKLVRASYKLNDDETATIDKDSISEVIKRQTYEVVGASISPTDKPEPTGACGCHNKENSMNREARVAALIASGKFKETDKTWLAQVPEEHFSTLEGAQPSQPATPPSTPATPPAAPQAPTTTPTAPATPAAEPAANPTAMSTSPQTADQFINSVADPDLRQSLREGMRMASERRQSLIASLKATGRNKFTDQQLAEKTTDELIMLTELAAVPPPVTFEGRGLPRVASGNDGYAVDAAPSFSESVTK